MRIVFAVAEEVALQPLERTIMGDGEVVARMSVGDPAPTARFTLHFDGEKAIELTGARWTVFEPFRRMAEAERFLKEAELAHSIIKKLKGDDCFRFRKSGDEDEDGMPYVGISTEIPLSDDEEAFLRRRT